MSNAAFNVFVENHMVYLLDQLSVLSNLQYGATTGIIEEIILPQLSTLYPNPAMDLIQLEFIKERFAPRPY